MFSVTEVLIFFQKDFKVFLEIERKFRFKLPKAQKSQSYSASPYRTNNNQLLVAGDEQGTAEACLTPVRFDVFTSDLDNKTQDRF